jgi:hypothetical protein
MSEYTFLPVYTIDNLNKISENSNEESLILMNCEDDTARIVYKLPSEYETVIKNWYNEINYTIDIDTTEIKLDKTIQREDLTEILYNSFNLNVKEDIINDFIPVFLQKIKLEKTSKKLFNKMISLSSNSKSNKNINYLNLILNEHNIEIPKNINRISTEEPIKVTPLNYHNYYPFEQESGLEYPLNFNFKIEERIIPEPYCDIDYGQFHLVDTVPEKEIDEHIVVYNYICNKSLFITHPNQIQKDITNKYTEYGFIELLSLETNNQNYINFVKGMFDNKFFDSVNELNKTLLILSKSTELFKETSNELYLNEEKIIQNFILSRYVIDNDIKNRMKFNLLNELIINNIDYLGLDKSKVKGLKNRLSQYLKNIGLEKKRYNDGFYYFGIRLKYPNEASMNDYLKTTKINKDDCSDKFSELIKQREIEHANYKYSITIVGEIKPILITKL